MALQHEITDDLDLLLSALPPHISAPLRHRADNADLLEVVMDLGRVPEARYPGSEADLSDTEVTHTDIEYVVSRIGEFGDDNRAGIERTLHRISCIRNRRGRIVGLTLRVGRAVFGTIRAIDDLVRSGKSILLLGRPGVGKTTMLREVARVLADEHNKRVIVVDTSNEIAGDGDIPHPGIGSARRMQVPTPSAQHAVMIEAVENHMPEVIIIDEIGTELEAAAARTIAERGVQLVATAHGNALENLMMNPTLADLIGGIQSVTLSDEEARRRGTQKSILERKAPPTFDVVVEIQNWRRVAVHKDVAETVDAILRGYEVTPEVRELTDDGEIKILAGSAVTPTRRPGYERGEFRGRPERRPRHEEWERPEAEEEPIREYRPQETRIGRVKRVYPFGVSRNRLEQAIHETSLPITITNSLDDADTVLTLKSHYRRKPQTLRDAESRGVPIYVLKSNTINQIQQALLGMSDARPVDPLTEAMRETEEAIGAVLQGNQQSVDLSPQNAYIRRLQHQIAQRYNLTSRSFGREPARRVRITRDGGGPYPLSRE